MGAFITAGVLLFGTLCLSGVILFAAGMSDSTAAAREVESLAKAVFVGGLLVSVVIASSHWFPHIGW